MFTHTYTLSLTLISLPLTPSLFCFPSLSPPPPLFVRSPSSSPFPPSGLTHLSRCFVKKTFCVRKCASCAGNAGCSFLPSFLPSVRPSFFPSLFNCIDGHVCVPRSLPSGILHSTRFEIPFPFLLSSFPVFSVIRVGNFASTHYSDAPVPSFFFPPSFRFFRPCRPFRHFIFRGECVYPCLRVGTPPASPFPVA